MSRLTKYFADGDEYGYELCYGGCESCDGVLCGNALEMINKLVHYEDLEDDGRLIELPCKVGDTVWYITCGKVYKGKCHAICLQPNLQIHLYDFDGDNATYPASRVFLTQEEAEQVLKQMGE